MSDPQNRISHGNSDSPGPDRQEIPDDGLDDGWPLDDAFVERLNKRSDVPGYQEVKDACSLADRLWIHGLLCYILTPDQTGRERRIRRVMAAISEEGGRSFLSGWRFRGGLVAMVAAILITLGLWAGLRPGPVPEPPTLVASDALNRLVDTAHRESVDRVYRVEIRLRDEARLVFAIPLLVHGPDSAVLSIPALQERRVTLGLVAGERWLVTARGGVRYEPDPRLLSRVLSNLNLELQELNLHERLNALARDYQLDPPREDIDAEGRPILIVSGRRWLDADPGPTRFRLVADLSTDAVRSLEIALPVLGPIGPRGGPTIRFLLQRELPHQDARFTWQSYSQGTVDPWWLDDGGVVR